MAHACYLVLHRSDPLSEFGDAEVWEALERVQLAPFVRDQENKLDTEVAEGGANLSVGQRQLLCLARALLRKPKYVDTRAATCRVAYGGDPLTRGVCRRRRICVFDEATASVDLATDALIQTMVREAFVDSTVITVAHRLETILDSDRIMALNDGRVEEFDTPRNLLDNPNGLLTSLVDAAGPETAAKLRAIVYRGGDVTEAIAVVQKAQAAGEAGSTALADVEAKLAAGAAAAGGVGATIPEEQDA